MFDLSYLNLKCVTYATKIINTPSDHYYLSLVWMYLDTKICLGTSTPALGNSGRREYYNIWVKRYTTLSGHAYNNLFVWHMAHKQTKRQAIKEKYYYMFHDQFDKELEILCMQIDIMYMKISSNSLLKASMIKYQSILFMDIFFSYCSMWILL
jgi:hypothetical protein